MRILIAPDSFKESMTAAEAAAAIARGVRRALGATIRLEICPMADGGEGTVQAMVMATGGAKYRNVVTGPLGAPILAEWGTVGPSVAYEMEGAAAIRIAIVEMAQACGLHLVPPTLRNPLRTTTYGVGELIRHALDAGARKIILGIGGSATNDGGIGMAQALGVGFTSSSDSTGRDREGAVGRRLAGADLAHLTEIDLSSRDPRLASTQIIVACDVTNPLYGPQGAACTYGPQKGATPEQVKLLDEGLRHLASLLPHVDATAAGMGAAGGLGFGLLAFCGARLERGIELVMQAVRFDDRVRGCDLVITGEGRIDGQSICGKTCIGVAQAAARHGVRTIALVGSAGPGAQLALEHGLTAYHSIVGEPGGPTVAQAMRSGPELLEKLTAEVVATHLT